MRRKLLSVTLCVCMMFTMVPFAFAEGTDTGSNAEGTDTTIPADTDTDTTGGSGSSNDSSSSSPTSLVEVSTADALQDALSAAKDGTIIKLTDNITVTARAVFSGQNMTVTLDLNNHTLTGPDNGYALDNSNNNKATTGKLIVKDGTIQRADNVKGSNSTVRNYGEMELNNVQVNGNYIVVKNEETATLSMNSCTLTAPDTYVDKDNQTLIPSGLLNWGTATATDSTITAGDAVFVSSYINNDSTTTLANCTVVGTSDAIYSGRFDTSSASQTVIINGGKYTGDVYSGAGSVININTTVSGNLSVVNNFECVLGSAQYISSGPSKTTIGENGSISGTIKAAAKNGNTYYSTITNAIEAASTNATIDLVQDTIEDVTVPAGKTVTLNLNGKKLTNVSSNTITNNGTLTITGTGTVDNVTHQKAALYNKGIATVEGGTYTRSAEASSATNSGNNSYYVIDNYGTLTINKGTFKFSDTNAGAFSSLIHNGWYDGNKNTSRKNAVMTINDGNFTQGTGGKITVKNDDYGELEIKGGVFTQPQSNYYCVYNYNIAKISGGTINGYVGNEYANATCDKGLLEISNKAVINGGIQSRTEANQTSSNDQNLIKITDNAKVAGAITSADVKYVTVSGGYFTTDPTSYLATNYYTVPSNQDGYTYMVNDQAPTSASIFVKDQTKATVDSKIDTDSANKITNVISKANVDGTAESISDSGKTAILNAAKVDSTTTTDKITIDVEVALTATAANLTGETASQSITFTAAPVATVSVNGAAQPKKVNVSNSYLNNKEITVTLPLPTGFTPKQIKHTSVDGTVEYFLDHSERGAKVFTIDKANNCAILKITKFSTFEVRGTQTYVEPSSGGSISAPTTYAVNVNAATNGAVAADKKTASKGTTVTVTASPSKGYVVDAVKVVDKDGKDVAVTVKDGKYVFTMPGSAVTVTGTFKAETPAPVALPFTDVKSGNWFYDAVKYAYAQGLMTGTSATTFAPNGTMNRAMIVTVLYRLEKSPAVTGASKFTDVPAGQWYSDAVAWAAANKIVNGYDETTFGPMNAVTREQMAAILFRYEQVKGLENVTLEENLNRFPDQNKISAYAIPALQWAVGQKIINGNADGTLDPTGTATRAQVAQIFTNLLNK